MNDTRKKIIELIEPFMIKDLKDGCLIKINKRSEYEKGELYEGYFKLIGYSHCDKLHYYTVCNYNFTLNTKESHYSYDDKLKLSDKYINDKAKIIGHYGISAVQKYADSKGYYFIQIGDVNWIVPKGKAIYDASEGECFMFKIDVLCLNTEEEDKHLLEILEKIK